MSDDDIPRARSEPPPPFPIPDKPAQRLDEPPSVELEGESGIDPSCEVGLTSAEADVSGPSTGDEDPRNRPKKPRNTSENERERSERREEEELTQRAQTIEPDEPGGETAAPGASHVIREGPTDHQHDHIKAENSPEPSEPPRDPRSDQEARRPVEGEQIGRAHV